MPLGQTLRKAREARKLTASQVAAATHMKVQTVEAIELEDFSRMPAAIYCKGFIKLYAEHLGLDPDPLTREYVERFIAPPPPPPEIQEDNSAIFAAMQSDKKEDLPPIAQEADEDETGPDLFSYGKKRKEEPPENLFEHKQPEPREDTAQTSMASGISEVSAKLRNAVTLLSEKISERTARIKESIQAARKNPEPEKADDQHMVDTSPITLPHRKILIISGVIAGIVLVIFLISAIARFDGDGDEETFQEDTERELTLPATLPLPYVD